MQAKTSTDFINTVTDFAIGRNKKTENIISINTHEMNFKYFPLCSWYMCLFRHKDRDSYLAFNMKK